MSLFICILGLRLILQQACLALKTFSRNIPWKVYFSVSLEHKEKAIYVLELFYFFQEQDQSEFPFGFPEMEI